MSGLAYKIMKDKDGNSVRVFDFSVLGETSLGITQGRGALVMFKEDYNKIKESRPSSVTEAYIDLFSMKARRWGFNRKVCEELSAEWGEYKRGDRILTKREVISRINESIKETGYAVVDDGIGRKDKVWTGCSIKKLIKYDARAEKLYYKGLVLGRNYMDVDQALEIERELAEIISDYVDIRDQATVYRFGITPDFGVYHYMHVDYDFVTTVQGVSRFLEYLKRYT